MNIFATIFAHKAVAIATAATLALGAGSAAAHEDGRQIAPITRPAVDVAIGSQGRVVVHNATVTAVSSSTITATTQWGGTSISWTVQTDSSTRFLFKGGRSARLGTVVVGDMINFEGVLASSGSFVVNATVVRDLSREQQNLERHTFEGRLQSLASTTLPTTLMLGVGSTNYTVNLATNVAILGKNWGGSTLSNFQVGDTVRVYGSLQASSTNIIDALVVRDASR